MELCAYVGRRVSPVGISLELCVGDLLSTEFSSFTPATRDTIAVETSGPVRPGISVKILFSQKLISWVFNDQPCECAVVGLNGSFPAAGGGDLGKNGIAKRIASFLSIKSFIGRFSNKK